MLKKKKKLKFGWIILSLFLIIVGFCFYFSYRAPIVFEENTFIDVENGDTIAKFYAHLDSYDAFFMRLWLKNNKNLIPIVQKGNYILGGSYSKESLLEHIAQGPQKEFIRITLLEGWSIYDIDKELTSKNLVNPWVFILKANDSTFIQNLKSDFSFLSILPEGKSLEGFLYPDTYFLDQNSDISEQLIRAQLKNFQQKIWIPYGEKMMTFWHNLSSYQVMILASVIENEEKNPQNKPTIAWIFLNRLAKNMRLDADVTLCYGLKITYNNCRQNIVPHLQDNNNPYNTRQLYGLMPTPISSPSRETLSALLNFQQTDYLYYLHDDLGGIHYGISNEEHNANVSNYLKK